MKKILKILFGRLGTTIIIMILQILVLVLPILVLSDKYVYVNIFFKILSIVMVIAIVNSKSNPMYKLIYTMVILIFPVFGGLFYLLITRQSSTKALSKRINYLTKSTFDFLQQDQDILKEIKDNMSIYKNVVYLNNYGKYPVYKNTDVTYFPVGEAKWDAMIKELKKAEKYIFMEYFIIKKGKFWSSILEILKEKAQQGVDVRLMFDGMGCINHIDNEDIKEYESYGIKCKIFNKFVPVLSTLHNNRDHRKILVIDGHTAFNGGINLADEYVNVTSPLGGHWKDCAVMLKGDAAYSFALMFLSLWQIKKRHEEKDIENYSLYKPDKPYIAKDKNSFVMPYGDSPLDGELVGEYVYLNIIQNAKKYVHIYTPYLILDNEMITALKQAAKSGIDVKIVMPHKPDHWYAYALGKAQFEELVEAGINIFEYSPGFIHSKVFVCDDEVAVVGTINLDFRSLYLHLECATWLYNSNVIADIEQDYENTISICEKITLDKCRKIGPLKRLFYSILKLFAPLM